MFGAVLVFRQILTGFEGLVTCQHYLIICCFGVFVWFLGEMRGSFAVDIGCCQQPGCIQNTQTYSKLQWDSIER